MAPPVRKKLVTRVKLGQEITRFFDKHKAQQSVKGSNSTQAIDLTNEPPAATAARIGSTKPGSGTNRVQGNNARAAHIQSAAAAQPSSKHEGSNFGQYKLDQAQAESAPVQPHMPHSKAADQQIASESHHKQQQQQQQQQKVGLTADATAKHDAKRAAASQQEGQEERTVLQPRQLQASAAAEKLPQSSCAQEKQRESRRAAAAPDRRQGEAAGKLEKKAQKQPAAALKLPAKRLLPHDPAPDPSGSLSQDGDDGCEQVVYRHAATACTASTHEEKRERRSVGAVRQRLMSAANAPHQHGDDSALSHVSSSQDQLLEQLLALPGPAKQAKSCASPEEAAPQLPGGSCATALHDQNGRRSSAGLGSSRAALGQPLVDTPASCPPTHFKGSHVKASGSGRKLPGGTSSGKRRARGKRKALLDVLDQVESLVQQQPAEAVSTVSCQTVQPGPAAAGKPQAAAAHDLEPLFDAAVKLHAGGEPGDIEAASEAAMSALTPQQQRLLDSFAQRQRAAEEAGMHEVSYRYIVLELAYTAEELQVKLLSTSSQQLVTAHLRDGWADCQLRPGDCVNLLGELEEAADGRLHAVCDFKSGALITQPQWLVSGTRVAGSYKCLRQSVLEERCGGQPSDKATLGTLLHELLQGALTGRASDDSSLAELAHHIVACNAEKLLEVGLDEHQANAALAEAAPRIRSFMGSYAAASPRAQASTGWQGEATAACLQEVVDIEESIWAPRHGLKGMVDASVVAAVQPLSQCQVREEGREPQRWQGWLDRQGSHAEASTSSGARATRGAGSGKPAAAAGKLMPLEFKSGLAHHSHKAQVTLYQLLMEERYGGSTEQGILWNLHNPQPEIVTRSLGEAAALLAQRNRVAAALADAQRLPPVIRDPRACGSCFQLPNCALYHAAVEGGNAESAGMGVAFEAETTHMSEARCLFLSHWLHLLGLEEASLPGKRAEIWQLSGAQRERSGDCLAGLVLLDHGSTPDAESSGVGRDERRYTYTFGRSCREHATLTDAGFGEGDHVVLSIDGKHAALARANILQITPHTLTLTLRSPLSHAMLRQGACLDNIHCTAQTNTITANATSHAASNATPRAAANRAGSHGSPSSEAKTGMDGGETGGSLSPGAWRVDKDDVSSVFVRMRQSLLGLCSRGLPEAEHLRRLIIDLEAPVIAESSSVGGADSDYTQGLAGGVYGSLNAQQQQAVQRIAHCQDYMLLLGMPGTGKTATIVAAVAALVQQGKTVLVTSYTNSAVDNILLRLQTAGINFLRLGRPESVHPQLHRRLLASVSFPDTSVAGMRRIRRTIKVVGCTTLGMTHALLRNQTFDMCLVDEAGQITLPASLAPLLQARAFALIGDPYQLPPLVQNPKAKGQGLGASLFHRLSQAHPQAVVVLSLQYRMAAGIQALSNALIYNGQLACGDARVEEASLQLRQPPDGSFPQWVHQALQPEKRVVFLDTDGLQGSETGSGSALVNVQEAEAAEKLLSALTAGGLSQHDIGVMSPYRSQVALLSRRAKARSRQEVEILTIDKFQGRDKLVTILSLVRSNDQGTAGRLLSDWHRINVASTRAKQKLIVIGSVNTIASVPLLQDLVELIRKQSGLLTLASA